jgi:hypothetical protein
MTRISYKAEQKAIRQQGLPCMCLVNLVLTKSLTVSKRDCVDQPNPPTHDGICNFFTAVEAEVALLLPDERTTIKTEIQ